MSEKDRPRQATVTQGVDMLIDTAQGFKNFVNNVADDVLDASQEAKNEVNDLIDKLVDKLQDLKG